MITHFIKVFGCQMNYSDAERISAYLEELGIKESEADLPAEAIAKAGLIIFVACGVRQSAEDRVYGQINNIHKKYPKKTIVLTGCLAHRKDVQRRLKGKVDLFLPIKDIYRISDLKFKIKNSQKHNCNYLKIKPEYKSSYTSYVPIMTGCNNFCAYCVVPYARGREYSRLVKDILKEARDLIKRGYKEIFLLGQNVNSYQSELKIKNSKLKIKNSDTSINFSTLLKLIGTIPGNFWVTFLTSHPKDMSDELIEMITNSQKICEYISLPAQSGDNAILKKMNRHYTVTHYKKLLRKIRSAYKKYKPQTALAISTDIIVGFPGETRMQFENTAKLLRTMKFDMAYISQYSPRPETAAWKLKDNVSKREKVRREKVLTEILKKTAFQNNKKYVGKIVEVLVDKIPKLSFRKSESLALGRYKHLGHTHTQKKVIFLSNKKNLVGKFIKVKITKAQEFGLEGVII